MAGSAGWLFGHPLLGQVLAGSTQRIPVGGRAFFVPGNGPAATMVSRAHPSDVVLLSHSLYANVFSLRLVGPWQAIFLRARLQPHNLLPLLFETVHDLPYFLLYFFVVVWIPSVNIRHPGQI